MPVSILTSAASKHEVGAASVSTGGEVAGWVIHSRGSRTFSADLASTLLVSRGRDGVESCLGFVKRVLSQKVYA